MESENKLTNLSQSEIAIKDFNTFASLVNAKPDAKTKFFYKNVRITKDSIIDLSERVFRKLSNAEDKNIFCKIYINFEDGNKLEYSSWDSFINKKITLTSALKSITLIWDFFVTLKNYNLPQRHRLMVKITDELKPEEYLHLVFTKKIEDLDEVDDIPNIVSSVEFVDHILADELLYIVEGWVKSVTCVEDNRLYKLVYDNKRKIAYIINYIPILFGLPKLTGVFPK